MAKVFVTIEVDAKDKLDASAQVSNLISNKYNMDICNISTDNSTETKQKWTREQIYSGVVSLESLVQSLETMCLLQDKYPNDDYVDAAIEIIREEICKLFGGTICDE